MERFEWLLSAQVTMGAGVPGPDVPYLEPSLSPGVQTCHRALAGTGASQFGPIHITRLLGRHSNSSFKAGITESIFQRHKLDE